jgi:hypothetical protein
MSTQASVEITNLTKILISSINIIFSAVKTRNGLTKFSHSSMALEFKLFIKRDIMLLQTSLQPESLFRDSYKENGKLTFLFLSKSR